MTLRARLVIALVVLLAAGLVVFGLATYRAFGAAELARLDEELVQAQPLVEWALADAAGLSPPTPGVPFGGDFGPLGRGGPPALVAPGTVGLLLDIDGTALAERRFGTGDAAPDLTALGLTGPVTDGGISRTVGSLDGGEVMWRVRIQRTGSDRTLVVAVPTTSVVSAQRGLLSIMLVAGAVLLAVLATGSWLVLRRGLRPLERMAAAARSITAGSLDQRVPVPTSGTEVATVGSAINGMLDDLEIAFAERAATEARLRRFVADASHELRTPLTSIQGYAELFRLRRDAPPSLAGQVDADVIARRIEEESGRMRHLVEDLLTLARLDEPRPLVRDPVDLAILAADACTDVLALAPDRPVRLDAPTPVGVLGDEGQLRQAVANLVANAVRHTPPGTAIEVTAESRGGRGVLAVRDHGPGVSEDVATQMFDRFWQADEARSGTGAGLGLSIVQAVAHGHGGGVAAAPHPDGGAVVTLTLPLDAAPAEPTADEATAGVATEEHRDRAR